MPNPRPAAGDGGSPAVAGEQHAALRSVLVVGTGLVGTSVALALRAQDVTVHVVDRDERLARLAADLGAGVAGLPSGEPHVVIVAVPPASVGSVIGTYSRLYLKAIFMDVASVASNPQHDVEALGLDIAARYVGGH